MGKLRVETAKMTTDTEFNACHIEVKHFLAKNRWIEQKMKMYLLHLTLSGYVLAATKAG